MRFIKHYFPFVLVALVFSSCRDEDPNGTKIEYTDFQDYLHGAATNITVEIAYEPNAEPYVGNTGQFKTWSLTRDNLNTLIAGHSRLVSITVPEELSEMAELPQFNKQMFTTQELLDLANRYRTNKAQNENNASIYIMFLNGRLAVDGEPSNGVLGVSLSGTSVVAVFKPVVAQAGFTDTQRDYVEQSTVIHEVGHAFGLVDVGVPPVDNHVDEEHQGHCNNEECVMYYANEGASGAIELVKKIITTGERTLFDENCIQDVSAF